MASLDDATRTQHPATSSRGLGLDPRPRVGRHGARDRLREARPETLAWLKVGSTASPHGNANLVALTALRGDDAARAMPWWTNYAGPKSALRPFHDEVIAVVRGLGDDVELAPKQTYVSLRRSKQFGTVGPASGGRLEIGLNLKGMEPTGRLESATPDVHAPRAAGRTG